MPANLVSRRLRCLIGSDNQDWSQSVALLALGFSGLDDRGIIKITGSLTLNRDLSNPASLDPRANPTRWRPGQPVAVQVTNAAGSWVDHPLGKLFILEEPSPLQPGQVQQEIQVGGWLAWTDTYEFDDDQSGVALGSPESCATVAQRLLVAQGIPSGSISLGTWPYTLAVPASSVGQGNFLGQAGGLAYSNDWRYLYQNPAGTVTQGQLSLSATTPVATVTLGQDDKTWEPQPDPQNPVELVKVAGIGYPTEAKAGWSTTDESTGNMGDYSPSSSGTGLVQRVTTTVSFGTWGSGDDQPYMRTQINTDELEATVFQVTDDPTQLIRFTEETETHYDDDSTPPRLAQVVRTKRQRGRSLLATEVFSNIRDVGEAITNYTHDSDGAITRQQTTEREAAILHDSEAASPWALKVVRTEDLRWDKQVGGEWRKREQRKEARLSRDSGVDKFKSNPFALITKTRTTRGNNGENQPPATQFWEPVAPQEVHYEGEATWQHPGGSTGRTRKRLFAVPFGFSNAQCTGLAELHRGLLVGRHRGDYIELPITDALLSAPPLARIDVLEPDGTRHRYLADALSWAHTQDEAYVACSGIWLGTVAPVHDRVRITSTGTVRVTSGNNLRGLS